MKYELETTFNSLAVFLSISFVLCVHECETLEAKRTCSDCEAICAMPRINPHKLVSWCSNNDSHWFVLRWTEIDINCWCGIVSGCDVGENFETKLNKYSADPCNRTKCIRLCPLPTDCTFVLINLSSCTKSLAERITVRHRKLHRHFTANRKCCGVDYGFSQINATSPIGKVIRVRHTASHSQFFHVHKCVNDSLREIELIISQVDFQAQG